ncbi:MAG: hypothetical protein QM626_12475 [Microbacterium sp.]
MPSLRTRTRRAVRRAGQRGMQWWGWVLLALFAVAVIALAVYAYKAG